MDIEVEGKHVISGTLIPSGSKNSVVALIPATILLDTPVTLTNVPDITDVHRLVKILEKFGSKIEWHKGKKEMTLDNGNLRFEDLDKDDLGSMKGTALLWGPMLARFGKVDFKDLPGGCTLGVRSLGPQYDSFLDLGIRIKNGGRHVQMDASRAKAQEVWLPEMSPTITENIVMMACGLKGKTRIVGAASEPQVQDVCNFLSACGAKISGCGSSVLEVEGGNNLSAHTHEILPDHYEIATFSAIAAATGGELKITNTIPDLMKHIDYIFGKFGVEIEYKGKTAIVHKNQKIRIKPAEVGYLTIKAQPWPSLPVDLLPIFIPLALAADGGEVLFHNWMYESGLFWTSELTKLGANIIMCDPHRVIVAGGRKLYGGELEAPYIIRAAVALTFAAMIAEGKSTVLNADAFTRGHPNFVSNLQKFGAKIEVI